MPFQMRAIQPSDKHKDWFRIDNAHVDTDNATDETTKVYIYDVIGDSWWEDATPAAEFVKQISTIKSRNIELHLNSPGGDIFDGVAIHNALKAHDSSVTVIVDGFAASAASFIAMAGDKIVMTKAATMMIHDASSFTFGNAADFRDTADVLDKLSNTVARIYADRAGQTEEFWRNLMVEETWYNASEAVDSGLADEIQGETKEEDKPQNLWDLSFFNHAGRGNAPDPLAVRTRIANRLKESTVPKAQTDDNKPAETGSPQADPDANTTEGEAGAVEEEREEASQAGAVPNPPTGDQAAENKSTFAAENKVGTVQFKMNGEVVTDPKVIQNYIETLEGFRKEANEESRKNFVKQLSDDNKILASQITSMTEYALGLEDEAFAAWAKLYDSSPALPMVNGSKAEMQSDSDGGPKSREADQKADRIDVLTGIVKQHVLRNTPEDKIIEKESYKELKALKPDFELDNVKPSHKR